MKPDVECEVAIIGGGPAGLSAALLLGRCLRKVIVCDEGRPRNESSPAMHGYLGLDGVNPLAFLETARKQLEQYETVSLLRTGVEDVQRDGQAFLSINRQGLKVRSQVLLLATGLIDRLPDVPGIREYYGVSVHHCPYCDGWENRGKNIGVVGADRNAIELARELTRWSSSVSLLAHREKPVTRPDEVPGIVVIEGIISGLKGRGKQLEAVVVGDGRQVAIDTLFFSPHQVQHADIAVKLGCALEGETILCADDCRTRVDGLFVAGNASEGIQLAIVAAAEGAKAAAAINDWLADRGAP